MNVSLIAIIEQMRCVKKISFLLVLIVFVISCSAMKDNVSISGKVESVALGKDGYTAKIKTDKNKIYLATVSIVNLGGHENYKKLKEGDVVSLKGDVWKADTEVHIKVKEILSIR